MKRRIVLPWAIWFLAGLAMIFGVVRCAQAVQLSHDECAEMAVWSKDIALMRDLGADKDKVRSHLETYKLETQHFYVILRTFDALWATVEGPSEILQRVYGDCVRRRGNFGSET